MTWKLDDGRVIQLLTPKDRTEIQDGTALTCIDGTTAVVGTDAIDGDTRGGFLAYGILQARKGRRMSDPRLPKALKLLEALAADHDQPQGEDHAWRTCRQCLAAEEVSRPHGRELMGVLVARLAALRQRHASAVEAAFREGYHAYDVECGCEIASVDTENATAAWLASEAKKGLT